MSNNPELGSNEFGTEFVERIVEFFGQNFNNLHPKERAHSIGVVANTLAALAVNQARSVDAQGMTATLDTLNVATNRTIEALVADDSVSFLFPQSRRICDVMHSAIDARQA